MFKRHWLLTFAAMIGLCGCAPAQPTSGTAASPELSVNTVGKSRADLANLRQQLFQSLMTRQGATMLPGHYGGDENADELAIYQNDKSVTLLLGLKMLDATGGLQLAKSPSGHFQLSAEWIKELKGQLQRDPQTQAQGQAIQKALENNSLVAAVVCLSAPTRQVKVIRLEIR